MSTTLHPRPRRVEDAYEEYQGWPPDVTDGVARHFLAAVGPGPRRALVLGCATGVNDALPLARLADPAHRIVAGDIDESLLARLRERVISEGLLNVDVRPLDVTRDLSGLGTFDLVSLLFVVHRLAGWEAVIDRLCRLVAPGGSFFISEFVGPGGIIYLSNEGGGTAEDPVSRMIRRYFELLPEPFAPALKSTMIAPVLRHLARHLQPQGFRDFGWHQSIMPGEMFRRIRDRAFAPYFSTRPAPEALDALRTEFAGVWSQTVHQTEVIRIHRFERTMG
jgi:SAM-dependent methyltransferase